MYVDTEFDMRPYDFDDVPDTPWEFTTLEKIGRKITKEDFADIKNIITSTTQDQTLKANRDKVKDEAWFYRGHSAEHVIDFLQQKVNSITNENAGEKA